MRPLVISGFMATGKSSVGRRVAERLRRPFVDLDDLVAQRAGVSVSDLFAREGEVGFRRREQALLEDVLLEPEVVVAVGGGALLDRKLRLAVLERCTLVSLTARVDEVVARSQAGARPLLGAVPDAGRVEGLLELRGASYAEAHARVATDGCSVDDVAEKVCALAPRHLVAVACGEASYAVEVGRGCAASGLERVAAGRRSRLLVTDDNVGPRYADAVSRWLGGEVHLAVIPAGEPTKTVDTVRDLWTRGAQLSLDRSLEVVALGGGVVSDVAGFFASTWLRGVSWGVVPTTLLSMVDASVGGKTGVDFLDMKNAIGSFWQPRFVVCDTEFLSTEPERGFRSALAEAVKTALIGDVGLFEMLEGAAATFSREDGAWLAEVVERCVRVKARIVSRDPRESSLRAVLNLGHTVGHALEAETAFARFTHGEAVSLGLVAALRVGVHHGVTPAALLARVSSVLERMGLPVSADPALLDASLGRMRRDKKRVGNSYRFVVAHDVGDVRLVELTEQAIAASLGFRSA
ncbi:MAG: 3-dehydroquinate synthase [Polyangiaceae bacterium]